MRHKGQDCHSARISRWQLAQSKMHLYLSYNLSYSLCPPSCPFRRGRGDEGDREVESFANLRGQCYNTSVVCLPP